LVIFTVTAIHQGAYKSIRATGKPMTFRGTTVAQMENGKIVEEFAVAEKMAAAMFGQSLHQGGTAAASTGQPFNG
jgi:predicted ester cyclase